MHDGGARVSAFVVIFSSPVAELFQNVDSNSLEKTIPYTVDDPHFALFLLHCFDQKLSEGASGSFRREGVQVKFWNPFFPNSIHLQLFVVEGIYKHCFFAFVNHKPRLCTIRFVNVLY